MSVKRSKFQPLIKEQVARRIIPAAEELFSDDLICRFFGEGLGASISARRNDGRPY